jgi:hypothetical protein
MSVRWCKGEDFFKKLVYETADIKFPSFREEKMLFLRPYRLAPM